MARAFKFEIGDVVRTKEGSELVREVENLSLTFTEHLTVSFRFWDGICCCYVLNAGDNDLFLISDEARLELEERPPMPEEIQPECAKESHFLGSVFRINKRLVAAEGLEKAIELFRSHPSHQYENIESITLQGDLALIQDGKEE